MEYTQSQSYSGILLYVLIAFANLNFTDLFNYAVQAIIGGIVWFGFKLLADIYDKKKKEIVAKVETEIKEVVEKVEEKIENKIEEKK